MQKYRLSLLNLLLLSATATAEIAPTISAAELAVTTPESTSAAELIPKTEATLGSTPSSATEEIIENRIKPASALVVELPLTIGSPLIVGLPLTVGVPLTVGALLTVELPIKTEAMAVVAKKSARLPAKVVPASVELVAQEAWLLEQIRVGEASNKEDLIEQSLYRLESIASNNPPVINARLSFALHKGDMVLAQKELDLLAKLAPNSKVYRDAKINVELAQAAGREKLQQARLLATSGQIEKAKEIYDQLFDGRPSSFELSLEYWQLVARLPKQMPLAIKKLQALNQEYPGSSSLRLALAQLLFGEKRDKEAYALLEEAAKDRQGRSAVADLWQARLKDMSVDNASAVAWQKFISVFGDDPQTAEAKGELERQQKLLADPAYQARLRGLARINRGQSTSAIGDLTRALKENPNDPELIGALGLAYSRNGQRSRALAQFEKAKRLDIENASGGKWSSLIQSTRYYLVLDQAEKAFKAGDNVQAKKLYQQAYRLDRSESSALEGQAEIALTEQDKKQAENYYRQAIKIDRNNVWLTYRLAGLLHDEGRIAEGDELFNQLRARKRQDQELVYAYSLYLSSTNRDTESLALLYTLPEKRWNENMHELADRLILNKGITHANQLRDRGDEDQAVAYLKQQPINSVTDLVLADWAAQRDDNVSALRDYEQILAREPTNQDAQIGQIESLIALDDIVQAKQKLADLQPGREPRSINEERRIANAWLTAGEPTQSLVIFKHLKESLISAAPSQNSAWLLRDAARAESEQRLYDWALDDYKRAMKAAGITHDLERHGEALSNEALSNEALSDEGLSDEQFTYLTRNQVNDDWLKRSIRSDAAELYRQQSPTVTLDYDYANNSGTPGISDLKVNTEMLQVDMPFYNGRGFFRADIIQMNSGSFSRDAAGQYIDGDYATCGLGCESDKSSRQNGTSFAIGWKNNQWAMDIGTTPFGFEVQDFVGGLAYSSSWNHIGWTLAASRRPIASSVLAFAGAKDPNLGVKWGGVRATGASLSTSYDRGEAHGIWGDLSFHQLTGKNIPDNQRVRLMGGYYYKLINEDNRRISVGLNSMIWHYQRDLSGYTLGQGGYYSPQQYFSLSIPVNYRQRTDNWSWEVNGSVSWSHSKINGSDRYPLNKSWPSLTDLCSQYGRCDIPQDRYDGFVSERNNKGSSSNGVGYTAMGIIERRLSSHWTLGAGIDIQKAKDYTPSHAFMYLRYSLNPWQGSLDLPPQPLIPYADFK